MRTYAYKTRCGRLKVRKSSKGTSGDYLQTLVNKAAATQPCAGLAMQAIKTPGDDDDTQVYARELVQPPSIVVPSRESGMYNGREFCASGGAELHRNRNVCQRTGQDLTAAKGNKNNCSDLQDSAGLHRDAAEG